MFVVSSDRAFGCGGCGGGGVVSCGDDVGGDGYGVFC